MENGRESSVPAHDLLLLFVSVDLAFTLVSSQTHLGTKCSLGLFDATDFVALAQEFAMHFSVNLVSS